MSKTISLREANQAFSRCIREVEAGEEFVITKNGQPVARLSPVRASRILSPQQEAAVVRMRAIMEEGLPLNVGRLNRDELHDREFDRKR